MCLPLLKLVFTLSSCDTTVPDVFCFLHLCPSGIRHWQPSRDLSMLNIRPGTDGMVSEDVQMILDLATIENAAVESSSA
jgi:hypothetical protein